MSGLGAPERTAMPIPDLAKIARVLATSFLLDQLFGSTVAQDNEVGNLARRNPSLDIGRA